MVRPAVCICRILVARHMTMVIGILIVVLGEAASGHAYSTAYNAIDACWRGDRNWGQHRMRLADCAMGFGRHTTGGKGGAYYVVTDPSDDPVNPKPGTLRYGAVQLAPLWIYFAHDMTISPRNELILTSDKTLDGRGAQVHIAYGPCLTIQNVSNVIVHGLHIHHCRPGPHGQRVRSSATHVGVRLGSDGDGISVLGGHKIWIDHNSLASCFDGLVDVIHASTAITISNNAFSNHDKVMLLGHNDANTADRAMKVTIAFNCFGPGLVQRMPRCRFGYFHVVNNDYYDWSMYAVGGSAAPTIISQGNRYRAGSVKQVTKRDCKNPSRSWEWRSIEDTFVNGAYFVPSGPALYSYNGLHQDDLPFAGNSRFAPFMTVSAGALACREGLPC